MFGWLQEGRTPEAQRAAGWSGIMSLPQVLSLTAEGRLMMEPAAEVQALRGRQWRFGDVPLAEAAWAPPGVRGEALELAVTMLPGDALEAGLALRRSPGGEEETRIAYDRGRGVLRVDLRRSSLAPDVARDVCEMPLPLAEGEPLTLRVFLDGSALELYANGGRYCASRIYPTRDDALGVALYARGDATRLVALDVWEMQSMWQPCVGQLGAPGLG